jgi:nicotinate dehydrogenase subunit A
MIVTNDQAAEPRTIVVNGQQRPISTEPSAALLYALRNELGLKGTRFGCGLGLCGACMVLVDGRAICSCDTPISAVQGKTVTTIEGLGSGSEPHPLVKAFIDAQAAQCGYCISGILIAAVELLSQNSDPSEPQVRAGLDRNLCRCGSHNRIVRAVMQAAADRRASENGAS